MHWNEIRDPIYGFIRYNDFEKEIINHPCFQRLRRIRQLALTDMVYPGAQHTRFEHSIGVMHLASRIFDSIVSDKKNMELLHKEFGFVKAGIEKDRQLIRIAALLHDIGHGPFSHGSEKCFPINTKTRDRYSHEDYSVAIIKDILKDTIEQNQFNRNNCDIRADDVAAFIAGNPTHLGDRIFWKTLISSQLDADRGDYLLRDSYHIGVKYGVYDLDRLIVTITLGIEPEAKSLILGVHEDGWHVAESLIFARYQIYSQIVLHKKRRAYDLMLENALTEIVGTFPKPTTIKQLSNFLTYDDFHILQLMKKERNYWCESILQRNHLKCIYENQRINADSEADIERLKDNLISHGIEFFNDDETPTWYKWDEKIFIIDAKRKAEPLSSYSAMINNIIRTPQLRIYVKPDKEEEALTVKEGL